MNTTRRSTGSWPRPLGGTGGGQTLDLARERLADLGRQRDAARGRYIDSLKDSPTPDPQATAPDTASIVILGSD